MNQKKSNPLKDFMEMLPLKEYHATRKNIINQCKINDQIFRNWKNGYTAVPPLAQSVINKIAGKEVFSENNEQISILESSSL